MCKTKQNKNIKIYKLHPRQYSPTMYGCINTGPVFYPEGANFFFFLNHQNLKAAFTPILSNNVWLCTDAYTQAQWFTLKAPNKSPKSKGCIHASTLQQCMTVLTQAQWSTLKAQKKRNIYIYTYIYMKNPPKSKGCQYSPTMHGCIYAGPTVYPESVQKSHQIYKLHAHQYFLTMCSCIHTGPLV